MDLEAEEPLYHLAREPSRQMAEGCVQVTGLCFRGSLEVVLQGQSGVIQSLKKGVGMGLVGSRSRKI